MRVHARGEARAGHRLRLDRGERDVSLAKKEDGLRGIVVDEQKRPVAGAIVQYTMQQMPLVYGTTPQQQMPSARTGRDGHFTLGAWDSTRAMIEIVTALHAADRRSL